MKTIKLRKIDIKRLTADIALTREYIPQSMVGKSGGLLAKGRFYLLGLLQLRTDADDYELLVSLVQYYCGFASHERVERVALYCRCIWEGRDVSIAGCDDDDLAMIGALGYPLVNPSIDDTEAEGDDDGIAGEVPAGRGSDTRDTLIRELGSLPSLEEMRPLIQSQIDAMGLTGQITVEEFSDIWS